MPKFPALSEFKPLIDLALREDVGAGDVTSELLIEENAIGVGTLLQKAPGVACGLPIVEHVCRVFDERLHVELIPGFHLELIEGRFSDQKITPLLRIRGPMRALLAAERTVLNFLQHLSGVATMTHRYVKRIEGTKATICDTRKTLPGFRALDKYAVSVGGATNHRTGLFDMVLVKDNHLAAISGSDWASRLRAKVVESRKNRPEIPIEVEVANLDQLRHVLLIDGINFILLDNMDCPTMERAVRLRDEAGRTNVQLEASGGVTLETVRNIALTGVERISVGAITHSAPALDISLEVESAE
ncbi:MAG TPA: carboxylating nicotinate-nucleotide diphosphorylase [Tepidisphaeraceae bacterium]|nr:carboxylating nicotinate-nucleotide diphosphorylase [Tepidisphaeraceae bacterium]